MAGAVCRAEPSVTGTQNIDSQTVVLKWKEGKQAVFLLEFDDSAPSHLQKALPELRKHKMVGTFYINPGNPPYKGLKDEWEKASLEPEVELANHTYTHIGATSPEQLDEQLRLCNEVIEKAYPNRKHPRLISFGRPGGVPWTVTEEQKKALLDKYHLVERPDFHGYPFQYKTREAVLALVDKALAEGEMGHHDCHGVGGDWLVTPMDVFTALLDKLEANRERIWITDPVSWHKYHTEREGAKVTVISTVGDSISLRLESRVDPEFYDMPLTLETRVPAGWTECTVIQGANRSTAKVSNGVVRYSALPGGGEIVIRRS